MVSIQMVARCYELNYITYTVDHYRLLSVASHFVSSGRSRVFV